MDSFILGLISDTHGLLRPEALSALQGSHAIIHAGDVGDPFILEQLQAIAPVHPVRGNVAPREAWAALWRLPLSDDEFRVIAAIIAPYMR